MPDLPTPPPHPCLIYQHPSPHPYLNHNQQSTHPCLIYQHHHYTHAWSTNTHHRTHIWTTTNRLHTHAWSTNTITTPMPDLPTPSTHPCLISPGGRRVAWSVHKRPTFKVDSQLAWTAGAQLLASKWGHSQSFIICLPICAGSRVIVHICLVWILDRPGQLVLNCSQVRPIASLCNIPAKMCWLRYDCAYLFGVDPQLALPAGS